MTEGTTAASPGATGEQGQAATPAQQGAEQPTPQPAQSGQAAETPQGQQGQPTGSTAQPGTPATPEGTPAAGQPATPTVPERYELRLPEQSPLDQSDLEAVAAMAKEQQWTNEQAQAVLEETSTRLATQVATFRTELDADPEVGGAKLEQAQLHAQRVLDRFLPSREVHGQRLRQAMNKSGYGNFTPLVVLLARIGQAMGEEQPSSGGTQAVRPPERSIAERLFGDAQDVKPPS